LAHITSPGWSVFPRKLVETGPSPLSFWPLLLAISGDASARALARFISPNGRLTPNEDHRQVMYLLLVGRPGAARPAIFAFVALAIFLCTGSSGPIRLLSAIDPPERSSARFPFLSLTIP
jgi:hypothetical protein